MHFRLFIGTKIAPNEDGVPVGGDFRRYYDGTHDTQEQAEAAAEIADDEQVINVVHLTNPPGEHGMYGAPAVVDSFDAVDPTAAPPPGEEPGFHG